MTSSTSSTSWSPFDCLAILEQTESGLILKNDTNQSEIDLLMIHEYIELRSGIKSNDIDDIMVPIGLDNQPDNTKLKKDWLSKESQLTLTITTHRIVFWKTIYISDNNNNNNDQEKKQSLTTSFTSSMNVVDNLVNGMKKCRIGRYIHLSNIFSIEKEENSFFKSSKILLSTSLGELVIAFYTKTNDSKKNRDETIKQLNIALKRQLWEQDIKNSNANNANNKVSSNNNNKPIVMNRKVGVDAIMSNMNYKHQQATVITQNAFANGGDVETLLNDATELVKIIHKYVATLDKNTTNTNNNDNENDGTQKLITMLQDMGMTSALRKSDYKGSDDMYYEELARQLADFLRPKFRNNSTKNSTTAAGVMTLTDIYCIYNRARGTHLISPDDLLYACEKMDILSLGFILYTFPDTGLKVLQDISIMNEKKLSIEFISLCENNNNGYITALDISNHYQISTILAYEQLQVVERIHLLVRDVTLESIRFYPNLYFK